MDRAIHSIEENEYFGCKYSHHYSLFHIGILCLAAAVPET